MQQAAGEGQQLQGLKALQGLARNAAMFLPLQAAFREAGGFALIVKLIDAAVPPLLQRPPLQAGPPPSHGIHSGAGSEHDGRGMVNHSSVAAGVAAMGSQQRLLDSGAPGQAVGGGADGEGREARQNGLAGGGRGEGGTGDEWGPGPQRIAPAVEAIAMLARNNPKNRCMSSPTPLPPPHGGPKVCTARTAC